MSSFSEYEFIWTTQRNTQSPYIILAYVVSCSEVRSYETLKLNNVTNRELCLSRRKE